MSCKCLLERVRPEQEEDHIIYSSSKANQQIADEGRRQRQRTFLSGNVQGLARATMTVAKIQVLRGVQYIDENERVEYPTQLRRILFNV